MVAGRLAILRGLEIVEHLHDGPSASPAQSIASRARRGRLPFRAILNRESSPPSARPSS